MPQPPTPSWSASLLRRDLSARAHNLARTQQLLHEIAPGSDPTIIFGRDEQGRHGNFHPASDVAICANPAWLHRLTKPHTASRRSRARKDWQWMELDTCNSSDALLMNIFCHPGVFDGHTIAPPIARLLNVDPTSQPSFGITPGVPLRTTRKGRSKLPSELTDRTEIDLQLDTLFLEAKLTESSFQTAPLLLIERYRDLEAVFDLTRLPRKPIYTPATHPPTEDYSQLEDAFEADAAISNEAAIINAVILSEAQSAKSKNPRISHGPPPTPIEAGANLNKLQSPSSSRTLINGYQLIRNVLAAYANDASFCVLCDIRRKDLIEIWYAVLSAVHSPTFATRLKLLTWQELSTTLPHDLQQFLDAKYGILPT